eukprot:tig00022080_g23792.t1
MRSDVHVFAEAGRMRAHLKLAACAEILTSSGLRYCPAGKHPVPIVASATIGGRAIMDSYGGNINWEGNGEGQPIYAYRESAMACCPANYSIAEPSPVQGQDAIWCRNGMASLQQNAPLATRQAPATGLRRFLGFKLDHDDQVAAADDSVTAYTADGFDAAADGEPFADAEDGADAAEASGAAFADADAHDAGILALAGPAEQLL